MTNEEKFKCYYKLCGNWLFLKNQNIELATHRAIKGKKIAIYGAADIGKRLYEDLLHSGITAEYMVDQVYRFYLSECERYTVTEDLPDADTLIVTSTVYFNEIFDNMKDKFSGEIISLQTIIDDLMDQFVK